MFNKNIIDESYALSCLENYVIYILKAKGFNFEALFCLSYMEFNGIFYDLFYNGIKYEYYKGILRLQDVGKNLGLINYISEEDTFNKIDFEDKFIAIRVTPEFYQNEYHTKLLREDHYILISLDRNGDFSYLNVYPRDCGTISNSKLKEAYSGKYIIFNGIQNDKQLSNSYICNVFKNSIKKRASIIYVKSNECKIDTLRDSIGIYRVILKRLNAFTVKYINKALCLNEIYLCDKLYTKLEYMRIKNSFSNSDLLDILHNVIEVEKKLRERIDEIWLI